MPLRPIPAALELPDTEYAFLSSKGELGSNQSIADAGGCLYVRPKSPHRSVEIEFTILKELEGQVLLGHRMTDDCFLADEVLLVDAQRKEVMSILSECECASIIKCFGFRWITRNGFRQCYLYLQHYRNGILHIERKSRPEICHRCLLGVAIAIEKLHSNGICHGGLAIENVFVNDAGEPIVGGFERAARCSEGSNGQMDDIRSFWRFAQSLILGDQISAEDFGRKMVKAQGVYLSLIQRCAANAASASDIVTELTSTKFAKILQVPMLVDYRAKLNSRKLHEQNSAEGWIPTDA